MRTLPSATDRPCTDRSRGLTLLLAAHLVGVAVAGGCSNGTMLMSYANQGTICIYPDGEENSSPGFDFNTTPRTYALGQLVNVAVKFPTCLSSSCSTNRMASCAVSGTGGSLQVTSSGSFVEHEGTCTTDCGALVAHCQSAVLTTDTTTFQHGGTTLTLTLPYTGAPPCGGGQ